MSLKRMFNRWRYAKTLDAPGVSGETHLTAAVKLGDFLAVSRFIDLGASVNQPNAAGEYPIFLSLQQKDERLFRVLISEDANVYLKQDGKSLMQAAQDAKRRDAAEIIEAVNAQDKAFMNSVVVAPVPVPAFPPNRADLFNDKKRPGLR